MRGRQAGRKSNGGGGGTGINVIDRHMQTDRHIDTEKKEEVKKAGRQVGKQADRERAGWEGGGGKG